MHPEISEPLDLALKSYEAKIFKGQKLIAILVDLNR